ncbi:imidazole glycerol phosphate synthase subunit HisH [Aureisphaera sp. CAU 1614]|uniref:Imidazole glycerol phosphate synthase subunit HisH n=1 Tax=Halomarinibacterium sedimenti TaxID=2857106 RepID=A0A9X1FPS7_9FLAO|nr:imidazole glycerol phosphate synthase subunit HisH [Halomarinibacterium sedimenti]MBW2938469.1 imidazole glycerol phosphate synthase subunit HisH [Halomarinibacterium sedimenti]
MIAILDYNAGNIKSVQNALNRLGYASIITLNRDELLKAEKVIIPGVGEARSAMKFLIENGLDSFIPTLKQPVLGICLGLQLLCKRSEEGNTPCLGIFESIVKLFPPQDIIPHMGWNNFSKVQGTLMQGIKPLQDFYYVHSYYATISKDTKSVCNYILPFSATLEKDNFFATQFHPEKSDSIGETVLKNFLEL